MGPDPAVAAVRRAVRLALAHVDGPVLVACSGGADSLALAAAVGSIALLAVVIFMLWPTDPSDTTTADRDQVDGEAIGWVSKVEANTIHVNSGPFGGGVVPLLVTKNTKITVGSKEGWFEDIRPGGQVKVVYQIAHGKRLASTVELLVDEGPRRPARGWASTATPPNPITNVPTRTSFGNRRS